jgi:hypothetical protein
VEGELKKHCFHEWGRKTSRVAKATSDLFGRAWCLVCDVRRFAGIMRDFLRGVMCGVMLDAM